MKVGYDSVRRLICFILCLCLSAIPVRAENTPKYVALTFDDGPSGRFTRRLLEGLEQRNVKATFLLCGYRLKEYPEVAEAIFQAGHEIGLHGYSHGDMTKMNVTQLLQELKDTLALLPEGCTPAFLRPPGGKASALVTRVAQKQGLSLLLWSVDPRDWENHNAAAVQAAVLEAVTDGDVILLHDMCDCSVDAALGIVDDLLAQGYRFVTASALSQLRGITLQPGKEYKCFR